MNYIIAGHGNYAESCLESSTMIIGNFNHVFSLSFSDDMSRETLSNKFKKILDEHQGEEFILMTDIKGGTPYNVAKVIYDNTDQVVGVVSGLSLQMLLPIILGENCQEVLKHTDTLYSMEVKESASNHQVKKEKVIRPVSDNGIVQLRIDERLIHGQVATAWIGNLSIKRVILVDEGVVKSDMEKKILREACPKNIRLSILTIDNAIKRINQGAYSLERVLIIVKNPEIANRLIEGKVSIPHINVGNMSKTETRSALKKSVYVSDKERKILLAMENRGIDVTAQMVPNEERKKISEYMKEAK